MEWIGGHGFLDGMNCSQPVVQAGGWSPYGGLTPYLEHAMHEIRARQARLLVDGLEDF